MCVHFRNCTSLKGVKSITSIFNRKDPYSILLLIILWQNSQIRLAINCPGQFNRTVRVMPK